MENPLRRLYIMKTKFFIFIILLIIAMPPVISIAAELPHVITYVLNNDNLPVSDAVIYLMPENGTAPAVPPNTHATMDQINKQYFPRVLSVQKGTFVDFPNMDNILHHVYSFSDAKQFELPLYKGTDSSPVLFDRVGQVVLGCNIHDWMIGYIYVLDTPWFGKSGDDGKARIIDVKPGKYSAHILHPDEKGKKAPVQNITVADGKNTELKFTINVKQKNNKERAPSPSGGPTY